MNRDIIENQTVETRVDQICAELELMDGRRNLKAAAAIILDLELSLRDCRCDLARHGPKRR